MENYERGRQRGRDEQSQRYGSYNEEQGRDREAWRPDDDRYGRRDEQRYGQGRSERSNFSPDWSREGAEARYSDDAYYARNRAGSHDESRGSPGGWRDDDRSRWEQRARESIPREQRDLAERSRSGEYYSPDWPYERGDSRGQRSGEGRYMQRGSEDEQGSHYRGYYSRSAQPFSYPGGQGVLYSESLTLHGPHTGRGPKGYKRSDQQINEDASQRLERDGDIDASEIEVTTQDGVITLRGSVPDRLTKRRAEECVESIYGARDVMNELRVSQQRGGEPQQGSLGLQPSDGSQGSQRSQGARSSQSSQSTAAAQRPGSPSGGTERQGEDKNAPKH
jgi:hypothetical protein